MATSETARRAGSPLPSGKTRPAVDGSIGPARRLRRRIGASLEYLWELSGSLRHPRADALVVEGRERETGLPLTAFYFGGRENFAFVFGRLCSEHRVVEEHLGVPSFRARRWAGRCMGRVSLLCVDVELLYCRSLPARDFLRVPQWIRQRHDIPDKWDAVLGSFRKNTRKTDLRKVRKYGFTYAISRSEKDFRDFYHHMYVPYLRARFEDEVIIEPEWKVLRQCRKGELMQILRDGRTVAAVLLHRVEGRLAYVWTGVPDGLDDDLYTGAFSAMYYFTFLHAFECGCRELDFLGSRPLLNDGLFRYKRKWGTSVMDSPVPRGDILLRPLHLDEPLRSLFRANPFVVRDGKDLVGKILLDGAPATQAELEEIHARYQTPGLRELRVFSLSGFEPGAHAWAEDPSVGIRLVDLRESGDPALDFCRT